MIYTIWLKIKRAEILVSKFEGAKVIEQDENDLVKVELEIKDNYDLLLFFQAGHEAGWQEHKTALESLNK